MNKKAQVGWIMLGITFIILIVILFFLVKNISYQHGTSKDIVMGYDKGVFWYHAYLINDHQTAYCFDDEKFIPLLEQSQKNNQKVIITYEKYYGRGFLCTAADNYERVIITNVEIEQ